ncbi:MAG: glycosyl hydrolase [Candidatus Dormibacteraceae bacterium]
MTTFADLRQFALSPNPPRSLTPLFWVRGESEAVLRAEIAKMDEGGMAGFVVESRPHPDFLGPTWWRDLEIILDEAQRRAMQVWLFDDRRYPSGYAGGAAVREHPALTKHFLKETHLDWEGPAPHAKFAISARLTPDEHLLAVLALPRIGTDQWDSARTVDLTARVEDGVLRWAVPLGSWRLFLISETQAGGEEGTAGYIDPLCPQAVNLYIATVYEPTYKHFGSMFGTTFQGFFTDEPRFGNAASYFSMPGEPGQVYPYTAELFELWRDQGGYSPVSYLPALWFDCADLTTTVRHDYMDVISARFAVTYLGRLQEWCHRHGVRLIGHLVEDKGAHARLGFGAGHFFRNMSFLDMGGCDIVGSQVRSEVSQGSVESPWGPQELPFYRWAVAKLASSSAHLGADQQKPVMCEAFGAYGWSTGLRLMKWLTDWQITNGINVIVPHAFSPAPFPDPDCPPHFWAHGANPQWPFFRQWADYANRCCALLKDGNHVAEVLVLYTAESSWAGPADPIERTLEALALSHIDADVVDYESFVNRTEIDSRRIRCGVEVYRAIILPPVVHVSAAVLERLQQCRDLQIPVFILEKYPELPCRSVDAAQVTSLREAFEEAAGAPVTYATLGDALQRAGLGEVQPRAEVQSLRHYHYRRGTTECYLFWNDSLHTSIATEVAIRTFGAIEGWDLLNRSQRAVPVLGANAERNEMTIWLALGPYETLCLACDTLGNPNVNGVDYSPTVSNDVSSVALGGPWIISCAASETYPAFQPTSGISAPGDWTLIPGYRNFAGTMRYQTSFSIPELLRNQPVVLDLGEVYELVRARLDDKDIGARICPPYQFALPSIEPGPHTLVIEVTNTLGAAIQDEFSRQVAFDPSGLLGPVRVVCVSA